MDIAEQPIATGSDTIPAYEAVTRDLAALGVETVFGLMGDDTAKMVTSLRAVGIKYHGARHENTAVAMADGYARSTGRLGVAMISRGPGLTNALTAAVNATKAGSPILLILGTGAAGTGHNYEGVDYKAFNNVGVASAAGLSVFAPASPLAIRPALRDAAAAALKGTAAALMVPIDLINTLVSATEPVVQPIDGASEPQPAQPTALALAAEALRESSKPLILAGYGAHRSGAGNALVELADLSGALLGTSLRAKDMFRGHPYNLGIVGTYSHAAARDLVSQVDTVIVFGASLTQFTLGEGELLKEARVVHVDSTRSHIGRYARADVSVVGDARIVAEQLVSTLRHNKTERPFHAKTTLSAIAEADVFAGVPLRSTSHTIDPRLLVWELNSILPAERTVVNDIGNFMSFVGPYLTVLGPDHYHYPMDFSAIGLGMGLALGVAAGTPQRPTVLFIGDGALLMTLGDLETVLRCDLPMTIVVMNDAAYGAEVHYLELEGLPADSARYPDVDFAEIATSVGMEAATVRSAADLRNLANIVGNFAGPLLLDCKVTPTNRS